MGPCNDLAFTRVRLESTGRLGAKDHTAAMWERNNRKARAETGAQLAVLTIQVRKILAWTCVHVVRC